MNERVFEGLTGRGKAHEYVPPERRKSEKVPSFGSLHRLQSREEVLFVRSEESYRHALVFSVSSGIISRKLLLCQL